MESKKERICLIFFGTGQSLYDLGSGVADPNPGFVKLEAEILNFFCAKLSFFPLNLMFSKIVPLKDLLH
jgi:hypothetical protein